MVTLSLCTEKEFVMKATVCNKFKKSTFCLVMALSFPSLVLANEVNEPVYDCTADETIVYINKATYGVYAPSPVQTPKEFRKAYVEQKMEEGDEGCVTIFTDGSLNDDWKDMVDTVRSFDLNISISSVDLAGAMEVAKRIVQEEMTNALEALGDDICQFLSSENMERLALGALNDKLGINARSLEIEALASEVGDLAYEVVDDDIQLLLSKKKMKRAIRTESRKEFRKARKELWDNL